VSQPATEARSGNRSIGEILLEHGFVTQDQLDAAAALQARSDKPLGQILVETEAITRLELATALAEQWSSTADWTPPARAAPVAVTSLPEDEPARALDGSREVAELGARLEARLEQLEAALQELGARTDRALLRVDDTGAETAGRLDDLAPALAELEQRTGAAAPAADVERLAADVGGRLAAAERALETGTERLERLGAALDGATEGLAALPVLRGELSAAGERLGALEERLSGLDALSARVEEIAAVPAIDPGLGERLDDLGARVELLSDTSALDGLRGHVDELATRLADVAGRLDGLAEGDAVAALQAALAELAAGRGEDGELEARVGELVDTVARTSATLDAHQASLEQLVQRLDGLADVEALGELRLTLDELAARPTSDAELVARLEALGSRLDEAASAAEVAELRELVSDLRERDDEEGSAGAVDELREALVHLERRLERVPSGEALEALDQQVAELRERPTGDPALAGRVEELGAALDELGAAVGDLAAPPQRDAELAATVAELAELVGRREGELDALRGELASVADRPAGDPGLSERLDELRALQVELAGRLDAVTNAVASTPPPEPFDASGIDTRIDALAATVAGVVTDLEGAVALQAALEARIDAAPASRAVRARPPGDAGAPEGIETELERMLMAIERLGLRIGEHDRALRELLDMQRKAARSPSTALAAPGGTAQLDAAAASDIHGQLRSLAFRLSEAEEALQADRENALTQIERIASTLTWRIQRLEGQAAPGGTA
jgi:hypothetical protein